MRKPWVCGTGAVLWLLAQCAGAAAQQWVAAADPGLATDGVVHTLVSLQPRSAPTTIAVAPDGQLWFTQSSGNRIGRINADGTGLVEYSLPQAGSSPRIIAVGADNALWFSEHEGNRISRISADGVIRTFAIPTPASQPRAIALGADGAIWFGQFAGNKIGRITPAGVLTEFELPTAGSGPRALAAGPDGNIWFSMYRAGKIGRITPAGVITEFALPRPNSGPGDITVGADGALWFVELSGGMDGQVTDGNRIGRITVAGVVSEYPMPSTTPSPVNIALGPDGNVWYTQGSRLGRVAPDGRISEVALGEGARGVGLTAGRDRQPPGQLVNRLYVADGAGDRILYLQFTPAAATGAPHHTH